MNKPKLYCYSLTYKSTAPRLHIGPERKSHEGVDDRETSSGGLRRPSFGGLALVTTPAQRRYCRSQHWSWNEKFGKNIWIFFLNIKFSWPCWNLVSSTIINNSRYAVFFCIDPGDQMSMKQIIYNKYFWCIYKNM